MKYKYSRKDKKVAKKSKTPKNIKKITKAKKQARCAKVNYLKQAPEPSFAPTESPAIAYIPEPEQQADSAQEATEPSPEFEVAA